MSKLWHKSNYCYNNLICGRPRNASLRCWVHSCFTRYRLGTPVAGRWNVAVFNNWLTAIEIHLVITIFCLENPSLLYRRFKMFEGHSQILIVELQMEFPTYDVRLTISLDENLPYSLKLCSENKDYLF